MDGLITRTDAAIHSLTHDSSHCTPQAIDVGVIALQNPGHAAWLGGSLIASGAAGQELWDSSVVTRQQWGEQGARVYRERGGSAVL
jgi:actin-related protein